MTINDSYIRLRDDADIECSRLEKLHEAHLACKPGCTSCCMDFSILPVEYHFIENELSGKKVEFNPDPREGECPLLVNGLCSIYNSRPFICRSHGLPLLSMGDEGWELSHCELNFTTEAVDFDEENTLPHDRYNSRLFMLNREFIKGFKEVRYNETDLIPLKRLVLKG